MTSGFIARAFRSRCKIDDESENEISERPDHPAPLGAVHDELCRKFQKKKNKRRLRAANRQERFFRGPILK
jgi:hypothetical protein